MGEIRTTARFNEIWQEIEKLDLKEALILIASHLGNSIREESRAKKYDEETGDPKEYEWIGEPWNGKLDFQFSGEKSRFTSKILERLPVGQSTIVGTLRGPIVVFHEHGYSGPDGSSPSYLIFSKPIEL